MNKKQILAVILVLVAGAGATWYALREAQHGHDAGGESGHHGHGHDDETEQQKGPHDGRLLREGDFAIEVTIFERGIPPEFRIYAYESDKPLPPSEVDLTIELHRFGGRVDRIGFKQRDDYLLGDTEVFEPHSFDVVVAAQHRGKSYRWTYDSYEGRTTMSPESVRSAGIVLEQAGPAKLKQTLQIHGRIVPNEDQMKHVIPRFPGVVREIRKRLGDPVAKDEVVAIVESNESLQPYEVTSSQEGTVIEKDVSAGEFVDAGKSIYVIADLSTVWVDLSVYRHDFSQIKVGQVARIDGGEGMPKSEGRIAYLSPFGAKDNQTMLARVVLDNPAGDWRPGLYVTAEVLVDEIEVPVAVKASALQTFRDWDVVFLNDGELFEIAILELGRRDEEWVEVVSGLSAGQPYATDGSFIIKADILKSGASHDH
jgi:cobalt-zinc-cadmium efflux system membrane fusion protein